MSVCKTIIQIFAVGIFVLAYSRKVHSPYFDIERLISITAYKQFRCRHQNLSYFYNTIQVWCHFFSVIVSECHFFWVIVSRCHFSEQIVLRCHFFRANRFIVGVTFFGKSFQGCQIISIVERRFETKRYPCTFLLSNNYVLELPKILFVMAYSPYLHTPYFDINKLIQFDFSL